MLKNPIDRFSLQPSLKLIAHILRGSMVRTSLSLKRSITSWTSTVEGAVLSTGYGGQGRSGLCRCSHRLRTWPLGSYIMLHRKGVAVSVLLDGLAAYLCCNRNGACIDSDPGWWLSWSSQSSL